MNKGIRFILLGFLLFLVISLPVNAGWGWLSDIFKGGVKSSKEAKITGNVVKKNIDDTQKISRQETKTFKEADDLAKKEIKTSTEKIKYNGLKGADWEKAVQKYYAQKAQRSFSSIDELTRAGNFGDRYVEIEDFTLIGGKNTQYYLNKKIDPYFLKEPDILIVKGDNTIHQSYPKKIEIIDAKTSEGASRVEQEKGFLDLCEKAERVGTECSVKYAEPKSEIGDLWNVACIATIFISSSGTLGPIVDVLCLIPVS